MALRAIRSERLRRLRLRQGWTHEQVATYTRIPEEKLMYFENCSSTPGELYLKRLAQVFSVTTDYLLGLTDCESEKLSYETLTSEEKRFIDAMRRRKWRLVEAMLRDVLGDLDAEPDTVGI